MKPTVLLDYEFTVAQHGYIVRALLKQEGRAPADGRVPLNLSLVLDRSGSMAGGKLDAALEAAALLVRRVRPEDVVSVVAYDDEVQTVALPATGEDQGDLPRRIGAIEIGGSTNLSGGWLRGRELVAQAKREGAVNRVLLLTDGQANVGITDPALLAGLCLGAKREGITTTTIGIGADYDERLLRAMADAGGANTYYIERPDQAPGVFEERSSRGCSASRPRTFPSRCAWATGWRWCGSTTTTRARQSPEGCGWSSGTSTPGSRGRCWSSSSCLLSRTVARLRTGRWPR